MYLIQALALQHFAQDRCSLWPSVTVSVSVWQHCSQMGPHLGTRVPMGTFFSLWVPIGSPWGYQ